MLIEVFVDNFEGIAFIRSLTSDAILYSNDNYNFIFDENKNFSELLLNSDSSLLEANLMFCQFVENKFKESLVPVFAKELFNTKKYITLRILVEFNNEPVILTLISDCKKDKTNSNINEIKVDRSRDLLY